MVTANGKPQRRQLSDQLDRFDTMLDGFAEALNETIADAVRDGTRLALKDAVIEILTDPALRAKLRDATEPVKTAPEPAKKPSFWQAAKARVAAAGLALKTCAGIAVCYAASTVNSVVSAVRNPSKIATLLYGLKQLVWVGASAGLAIAVVSYFAPHAIAAALSGITAATAAISMRASKWSGRTINSAVA